MARDLSVHFAAKRPTQAEIEKVITDFLGGIGSVEWVPSREFFLVSLPGTATWALQGILARGDGSNFHADRPQRTFEVYPGEEGLAESFRLTTRLADDFTNAVAEGLAAVFAVYWEGNVGRE